jgi:hypothetical protein
MKKQSGLRERNIVLAGGMLALASLSSRRQLLTRHPLPLRSGG